MLTPLVENTPIEYVRPGLFVKREDLACQPPGPPFAKVRGLWPTLIELKRSGIKTVGYMDTTISMAGWGLSYFCSLLDLNAVIFYPERPASRPVNNLEHHKKIWLKFGAEIRPINTSRCTRLSMQWYKARSIMAEDYPNSFLLPQGLPCRHTVNAVAQEVRAVGPTYKAGTVVINAGSGVMTAGVLRGLHNYGGMADVIGIMASPKNPAKLRAQILEHAGLAEFGFMDILSNKLEIIDAGYGYEDRVDIETPFPCNSFYDKKAWAWMENNFATLKLPVLFWNIGAEPQY